MKIDFSDRTNMFYWQTNRPLTAEETKRIFLERHERLDKETLKQIVYHGMTTAKYKDKDTQIKEAQPIIKRGSVNSVIPVVLQSGRKIILRIHPKGVKNGYFWVEKVATSLAKKQGVPTYKTICVDDSQKIVPFDFMILSPVEGKPIQNINLLNSPLEQKLVTETGKYAALIHKIIPQGFGFFLNKQAKETNTLIGQYPSFEEHIFAALLIDLKFLADNQVLTIDQSDKIERLFENSNTLIVCQRGSLIHNDIADWNELSDGKKITGIMDWDECFSGDPMMEVAAYNLFFGEPRITWFRDGYSQISQLENNEDKFQLFKLRYLISKMHLRKKRLQVDFSPTMKQNLVRGMQAMKEVFKYFKF